MPVNILPVKKETYYSKIKVISKEKPDGTQFYRLNLMTLNDLQGHKKNVYQILFMKITYNK